LELETAEVVVAKLPCPSKLLAQYEGIIVAGLLVDQKEWQVHGPQVTTSMFALTVYVAYVEISTHLGKFHADSTI
jgi:hypothetical protein